MVNLEHGRTIYNRLSPRAQGLIAKIDEAAFRDGGITCGMKLALRELGLLPIAAGYETEETRNILETAGRAALILFEHKDQVVPFVVFGAVERPDLRVLGNGEVFWAFPDRKGRDNEYFYPILTSPTPNF